MRNDLFKVLLGAVLAIMAMGAFKGCNDSNGKEIISSTVEIVTVHDTTYIEGQTDTVFIEGDDIIVYVDTPVTISIIDDSIREYRYEINNADLVGVINTQSTGSVKSNKLEYKVICPVITKTDTLRIVRQDSIKTTVVKQKLFNLSIGANMFSTGSPNAGAYLRYNYKKNINLGVGVERTAANTIYGVSARYTLLRW